jgi:hypothetical protein
VRQIDVAGNLSGASSALAFTLDTTAAAPTLALDKDTGISGTDKITSNGKINLTGLESNASWEYSVNAGTSWTAGTGTSLSLTGDGAKSLTVRQTDVAGNLSNASSALEFTLDTLAPSKAVITSMTTATSNTIYRASGDNTPDITVTAETGAQIVLGQTVNGIATPIDPSRYSVVETATKGTYTVSVTQALADGGYGLVVRDAAGNMNTTLLADGTDLATFAIDTVAPTVTLETADPQSNGALAVTFKFSEKVYNFDVSDISVINGTKSAFLANADGKTFSALITPSASNTPQTFSFEVAAGAATDAAGNSNTASTKFSASALVGTAGNDVLSVSNETNWIFLGAGGDDTIKLSSASGSTVAAADRVFGFGTGDKIDVSAILGGVGYTSWAQSSAVTASASSPIVLKNAAIVDGVEVNGDGDDTLLINHVAQVEIWSNTTSTLFPSTLGLKFDFATNSSVIDFWIQANTGIAVPLNSDDYNAAGIGGMTGTANFTSNKNLATAYFALSDSATGLEISLDALQIYNNTTKVFEDKVVPLGVSAGTVNRNLALTVVKDTAALGAGDNQLHMLTTYDASTGLTRLQVQYDTDSVYGANHTTASSIIAMDFLGDLTSALTPANLIFI